MSLVPGSYYSPTGLIDLMRSFWINKTLDKFPDNTDQYFIEWTLSLLSLHLLPPTGTGCWSWIKFKIIFCKFHFSIFWMMTGKITITVWEERKIKNFLEIFPPWQEREREREMVISCRPGHFYCGPRVCLLGWFCKKIPARERERGEVRWAVWAL